MQFIKVKYVGKGDSILTEYNGVKYNFSKSNPIVIIPLQVYNFMQDYHNVHREDIVPCSDAAEEVKQEKKKTIEDDIEEIEKSIEKQEEKEARGRGRPRKIL